MLPLLFRLGWQDSNPQDGFTFGFSIIHHPDLAGEFRPNISRSAGVYLISPQPNPIHITSFVKARLTGFEPDSISGTYCPVRTELTFIVTTMCPTFIVLSPTFSPERHSRALIHIFPCNQCNQRNQCNQCNQCNHRNHCSTPHYSYISLSFSGRK